MNLAAIFGVGGPLGIIIVILVLLILIAALVRLLGIR